MGSGGEGFKIIIKLTFMFSKGRGLFNRESILYIHMIVGLSIHEVLSALRLSGYQMAK